MPLITFTTDFGADSPYVAQMKAVALQINVRARLVDITHAIGPQDVRHGAVVLADVAHHFPAGTIHVAVVDPGVGTARQIIYLACGNQQFVAPDNGLLSLVAARGEVTQIIAVETRQYWRQPVSSTFHGRDIMAPVAAHLTRGILPHELGRPQGDLQRLDWPPVTRTERTVAGTVLLIDHFGNIITNLTRDLLPADLDLSSARVRCGQHTCEAVVSTYGEARSGTLIALFGSSDRLEIAVAQGNAAHRTGCKVGAPVQLSYE